MLHQKPDHHRTVRVRVLLFGMLAFLLSGCTSPLATYIPQRDEKELPPVVHNGANVGAGSTGVHTVRPGENVHDIAIRYRLPLRDILDLNALIPPYRIAPPMRLKLPPPRTYIAKRNDTLVTIARTFNVSTVSLQRLNGLSLQSVLQPGTELRLPHPLATAPLNDDYNKVRPLQDNPLSPAPVVTAARTDATAGIVSRFQGRFLKPVDGTLAARYGDGPDGTFHDGVNWVAARGSQVRAAASGTVVYTGDDLKSLGNLVLIRHDQGYITAYAHLDEMTVSRGEQVQAGALIGRVGTSGRVDTPQLHFQIRKDGRSVDPVPLI